MQNKNMGQKTWQTIVCSETSVTIITEFGKVSWANYSMNYISPFF